MSRTREVGTESSGSPARQRGLVTLLFTDLADSTRLKQELGEERAAQLFERHHQLVRSILAEFSGGEEVETAGDSFFLVFAAPSEAVQFATRLRRAVKELSAETGVRLQNRMGIHLGEALLRSSVGTNRADLFGLSVDHCARVMSLAAPGQILMTRPVFDNARQALKGLDESEALAWWNHGAFVLKGIDEPVEICEVGRTDEPMPAPTGSEKAQRLPAERELVPGWRPGVEQRVPRTQWLLTEKLGEGGFGEVWLARHEVLKERRVLKFCFQPERARSLKREVTIFRVLKERLGSDPRIVAVHEVSLETPPFYLVMDHAEGKDLKGWLEEQGGVAAVPLAMRLELLAQASEALAAAHAAGILHRDVKPSNLLVCSDEPRGWRVKLTDFGIGQVVSKEAIAGMTQLGFTETVTREASGTASGTQLYMAPELLAGRAASRQSDLYSLGVMLYQLVVGDLARPVTPDWSEQVRDPDLQAVLRRSLASDPERRFESGDDLARAVRRAASAVGSHSRRVWSFLSDRPWIGAGLLAVLLLGVVALAYGVWEQNQRLLWEQAHPGQDRAYRPRFYDSVMSGAVIFFSAVSVAVLSCATYLDWKARGGVVTRRMAAACAVGGAVQILFALFLLMQWIKARNWGIAEVWYRYAGAVLMTVVPACWAGLFLIWRAMRDHRQALFAGPGGVLKAAERKYNSRAFLGLLAVCAAVPAVLSMVVWGPVSLSGFHPQQDRFLAMSLMTTVTVWCFSAARANRGDVRQFWSIFVALGIGLLAMCVYLYELGFCLAAISLGAALGLLLVRFGR